MPTNLSLICPHAAESFMIKYNTCSIQMHNSILFVNSSIHLIKYHLFSHLLWYAVIPNKQLSPQCFTLHFKAVASQQQCQGFDVTHHITKQTNIGCLPATSKATRNKKMVISWWRRLCVYRDDNKIILIIYPTCFIKWDKTCSVKLLLHIVINLWNSHL